ncbi:MAG: nickel-dependent hydrogenase large subunit [Campylobacterales bacterium]
MSNTVNIPIGAQHISLLEPLRFIFKAENEKIVDVEADFGYVHRGYEKACETNFKFKQISYAVSRVCGLCSITHASAYTFAIEKVMGIEVPLRAKYLRMLTFELDRIHSHMLCLSHTAESAGFEALFMRIMKDRESIMEIQELLTGNRIHFDFTTIGGVNRDVDEALKSEIEKKLYNFRKKIDEITDLFLKNYSLSLRYKGVGKLTSDEALELSAVGPLLRATGIASDTREETTELPYGEIGFKIATESGGDIHSRNIVRLREIDNSLDMIEQILANLPDGEIDVKVKGMPEGEGIARVEAPRGELCYYIKGVKKQYLDRVRIKTPTYSNIPSMIEVFKGEEYASAPPILASLDPCMSCTAK